MSIGLICFSAIFHNCFLIHVKHFSGLVRFVIRVSSIAILDYFKKLVYPTIKVDISIPY